MCIFYRGILHTLTGWSVIRCRQNRESTDSMPNVQQRQERKGEDRAVDFQTDIGASSGGRAISLKMPRNIRIAFIPDLPFAVLEYIIGC